MTSTDAAADPFTARGDPPAADERQEVLVRQIQVTVRILTFANLANIASIIMTAVFMVPAGGFRIAWGASMLLVITNSCRMWFPWLQDPYRSATRHELVILTIDVMVGGALYAALAAHVVPQVSGPHQVVLVSTLVGVIGAGAIALSTIRSIGFGWLAITTSGLALGFVRDGVSELPLELAQLALYTVAVAVGIAYLSWSFEQRCRAELAAERDREVVSLLLDDFEGGARDWLWNTDTAGRLVTPSSRLVECSGRTMVEIERGTLLDLLDLGASEDPAAGGLIDLRRALEDAKAFREVVVPVLVDGDRRWWSLAGTPRRNGSWRGVGSDVTDSHEYKQEILRLASIDALTDLANRHTFSAELRAMVDLRPEGRQIRLAILDLDNFKTVNDTLGHPIGDRLLVEVAGRLREVGDRVGMCARLGGDEFAVVSAMEPEGVGARPLAAALTSVFDRPFTIDGTRLEIRGSVGMATIPGDASDADELVMLADLALYAAKDAGTGQVRPFEPKMRAAAEARARAQRDLQLAIAEGAFEMRYQPLVAASGEVVAFEALARWHHAVHGWIPPTSFIAVAEETGLIVPLGDQLLEQALTVAAVLPRSIRIAVNVAPAQLVSTGFADRFQQALRRYALAAQRVDVEVTESAVVDPEARKAIDELRRAGCGVAVDDFGTGFSSFASLQEMPITQLKIDRAFISRLDLPAGARARAIVRAIVDVAEASGLSCVAEGVETEEQRRIVRDLGCTVQGYIEARPMPASEIDSYLASRG